MQHAPVLMPCVLDKNAVDAFLDGADKFVTEYEGMIVEAFSKNGNVLIVDVIYTHDPKYVHHRNCKCRRCEPTGRRCTCSHCT